MENNEKMNEEGYSLVNVITSALKIPGVKVDRDKFLREQFKSYAEQYREKVVKLGPIKYGCSEIELKEKAHKIVREKSALSTGASFLAGIPGGLAMAAAIPADVLQFYAVALRLAQELAYLYGEDSLWVDGIIDDEKVRNKLILYLGVMMGTTGATSAVRLMASGLAKQALTKLPQKALTKGFFYPIVKNIAKAFGYRMTKGIFAKGVAKVIPILGGIVSGGITLASMLPMGMKLADTLNEAHFGYSEEKMIDDWKNICDISKEDDETEFSEGKENDDVDENQKVVQNMIKSQTDKREIPAQVKENIMSDEWVEKLRNAKQLVDDGIITNEEFQTIKSRLIGE